jgi:CHASE2 domain-containing sensor protein
MANALLMFPTGLVTAIATHPVRQFLIGVASAGALSVLIGLWIGSFTPFGPAASGLMLSVIAQGAEMYEQTIPDAATNRDEAVRQTKIFAGSMKLLGLILLGLGAMVGLSATG